MQCLYSLFIFVKEGKEHRSFVVSLLLALPSCRFGSMSATRSRSATGAATAEAAVTIQQMLNERRKEQVIRKANSERLHRLDAVAMEVRHRTSSGITEDLLRQKQARARNNRTNMDGDKISSERVSGRHYDTETDGSSNSCDAAPVSSSQHQHRHVVDTNSGTVETARLQQQPTTTTSATPLSAKALVGLNAFTDPRRGGSQGSAVGDVASLRGLTSARLSNPRTTVMDKMGDTHSERTVQQAPSCDGSISTSARSAPPALGDGARALQGPRAVVVRRVDRLAGKQTTSLLKDDDDVDEDEDDAGFENGGHVCVVTTHARELLFSGRASSAPMISEPIKTTLAGALPVSLRAAVKKSNAADIIAPSMPPSSGSVRRLSKELEEQGCTTSQPPSAPPPPSALLTADQEQQQQQQQPHKPLGAKRPSIPIASAGARPTPTEGWTNNHGGGPKSILKRHPIPRKHSRRVRFALSESLGGGSTLLLSSSGSLRLSKDGPPVAFSLPDVCSEPNSLDENSNVTDGANWMATVVIPRSGGGAPSPQELRGRGVRGGGGWGADSETFNQEWGLPSPNTSSKRHGESPQQQHNSANNHGISSHRSSSIGGGAQRGTAPSGGPPLRRNNNNPSDSRQRQMLLSSLTFHTGLSMEEARLLAAIADVNTKLRETGHVSLQAPQRSTQRRIDANSSDAASDDEGYPTRSGDTAPSPLSVAVAPTKVLPVSSRSDPPQHSGGMIVVDPNRVVGGCGGRGSSAPPPASTSRYAPAPTQRRDSCQVVVAPQEVDIPENILAALPKRKSDHQALTRRDRFGKKMSLVGR
jgi:hypothetical protein